MHGISAFAPNRLAFGLVCTEPHKRNLQINLIEMFTRSVTRSLSASAALNKKVAVLGAAGGIGQPLALLLKVNKLL